MLKYAFYLLLQCLIMNSNVYSEDLEDRYLAETSFPVIRNNFIVISGCSGGGKSSLLSELSNRGYPVALEPGRQIVKEQTIINGDALPWINLQKFLDLALSRYLFLFNSQNETQKFVFFDRGIVDAIQLSQTPKSFDNAAKKFRYNKRVFLVPPWEEIFTTDAERKHSFESAKNEFDDLLIKYKNFGYETILVPKVSVKKRADFILDKLGVSTKEASEPHTYINKAKRLIEWNTEKLTNQSNLQIEDLKELFAPEFVVIANERKYDANYQDYYEFLNRFRAEISSIHYKVQEYISDGSTVVMPLRANVKRLNGTTDIFDAIMLVKFNDSGKIIHWQEVYSVRKTTR